MGPPTFTPNPSLDTAGLPSSDEATLRKRLLHGDVPAAVSFILERHGPELFGFLIAVLDDVGHARMLYADVCLKVVSEVEAYLFRSSLRAWLYGLARRELQDSRLRRKPAPALTPEGGKANEPGPKDEETNAAVAVRRTLSEEERELLILCIDRGFDWNELAVTQLGEDASLAALSTEAQVLRVRMDALLVRIGEQATRRFRLG